MSTHRVLVGTDGSAQARVAVSWAASQARRRGWPLVIAMAHEPLLMWGIAGSPGVMASADRPPMRNDAAEVLERLAQEVRGEHPGLEVSVADVIGAAAGYLTEASAEPGLVVIGTRGLGGLRASLLGGVADEVVTYARGPVAVIGEEGVDTGTIVVGVDEGDASAAAVEFAADEARLRGATLDLVRCLDVAPHVPTTNALAVMPPADEEVEEAARASLATLLGTVADRHPDLAVTGRVVCGAAAPTLVDASREASLVVVGSRGRGGFTGLLLGSTSRKTVRDAHGPVVVVPSSAAAG